MGPEPKTDDTEYDLTSDLADDTVSDAQAHGDNSLTDGDDGVVLEDTLEAKPKQQDLSLRDQLSNAFKAPEDDKKPAEGKPAEGKPAEGKQAEEKPGLTKDAEGRWRKLDGTFASTEEIEAAQQSQQQQPDQSYESLIGTLPANVAEQFKSLPAETQQFVARTMEDLNNRGQRYSEYDQLEQVIGPRREAWQREGMNPVVAVNQLLALSDYAGSNPAEFVLWFADQHNIDLDAELDKRDAAGQASPEVQQLRGQVSQLSQTLQQMQQGGNGGQPDANLAVVQNFASETDEGGNLKRPYLNEVMSDFAAQVSAVRLANPNMPSTDVLSKAYEAACWANPSVRTKMQQEVEAQRREAARQKLAAKKNASSGVRGGPSGGVGVSPANSHGNRSLREELEANFRAQGM